MPKTRHSLLLRYLLYYGVILLVPLLILLFSSITLVGRLGVEQTISQAQSSLTEGTQRMAQLADESNKISLMLLDEIKMMESTWNQHRFSEYKIVEYLSKQKSTNSGIADIIVVDTQKQVFYSSFYAGDIAIFEQRYQTSITQWVDNVTPLPGFERHTMATLYEPWLQEWTLFLSPPSVMYPQKTVLILFNSDDIINTMGRTHVYEDDIIAFIEKDGKLLAKNTESVPDYLIMTAAQGDGGAFTLKGAKYKILRQPINTGGDELLLLLSNHSLNASLKMNYLVIAVSFLVSLLFGSFIILAALRKTYHPLSVLLQQVQDQYTTNYLTNEKDLFGYEYLNEVFTNILTENERLKNALAAYNSNSRQFIMLEALSGERLNAGFPIEEKSNCYYQVLIVRSQSDIKSERIPQTLMKSLGANDIITVPGVIDYSVFIVVSKNNISLRMSHMSTEQTLQNEFNAAFEVTMGDICENITEIGRSYATAFEEFHTRSLKQEPIYEYPYDKISAIHKYLTDETVTSLVNHVSCIFHEMHLQKVPMVFARCVMLEIINEVMSALMQSGLSGRLLSSEFAAATELVNARDSLEAQELEIIGFIRRAFDHIAKHRRKYFSLQERVDDYIAVNYTDSDLSIQSISDEIDVSVTYLRNTYRNMSGQNISDKIWEVRFAQACRLLRETDLPVQDVAKAVGYRIASSFIRKFRDAEGLTPGEYRQNRD